MADDATAAAAATAASAAKTPTLNEHNNSSNNNNSSSSSSSRDNDREGGGGNGLILGLVGHALRNSVGALQWAGHVIGAPMEQEEGERRPAPSSGDDPALRGSPPSSPSVQPAASGGDHGLGSPPVELDQLEVDQLAVDQLLAMAAPETEFVDGAEPAAPGVGGGEGEDAPAGGTDRRPRDRAAAVLVSGLERRCFWYTMLLLVGSSYVLGFVSRHLLGVYFDGAAASSQTRVGPINVRSIPRFDTGMMGPNAPGISNSDSGRVGAGGRDFTPGIEFEVDTHPKNIEARLNAAYYDFDVELSVEEKMAARSDFLRAERNQRVTARSCTKFCKKNDCSTSKVCAEYSSYSSSSDGIGSSDGSSGSSNIRDGGGGGRVSRAFRAFSAWRLKHQDAAQDLLDGPWY